MTDETETYRMTLQGADNSLPSLKEDAVWV